MKLLNFSFLFLGLAFGSSGAVQDNSPEPPAKSVLSDGIKKTSLLDTQILYIQFSEVNQQTAPRLAQAQQTNKNLRGVVLDLRFAGGKEARAAAGVADLFTSKSENLLEVASEKVTSSGKSSTITLPVAVLVNSATTGASEVLAALLKELKPGLVFGSSSAGTNFFSVPVSVKGRDLQQVQPDISVASSLENEMLYLEDPYKEFPPKTTNEVAAASALPRLRRRINEAELVRSQRGAEEEIDQPMPSRPGPKVIRDPVLARGLDFLKGLSIVQGKRS